MSPRTTGLILFALSVASFAIGTGEFSIMGLLPQLANDLGVDLPVAGHLVSAYAFGVVVGAPVLAVACARLPRDRVLVVLLGAMALGNVASALAPSYHSLMVLRFATGLPHGTFFGVSALVAADLVGRERRAQAVGRVMVGLTIAGICGTPLATAIGQHASWRVAYLLIAVVAAAPCALLWAVTPHLAVTATGSPLRELGALRRGQVWLTLGIGSIGFGGLFAIYTFIAPIVTQHAGAAERYVPIVVAVIGVGMVVGNVVGGRLADRSLIGTVAIALVWNVVMMIAFAELCHVPALVGVLGFCVGGGFMLVPALQTRLMDVAGDAQTLAAALNHAAFNIANALGAWLGGVAVRRAGWNATGWVGAGMAVVGLVLLAASLALERRRSIAA